jgi:hypothetical protein
MEIEEEYGVVLRGHTSNDGTEVGYCWLRAYHQVKHLYLSIFQRWYGDRASGTISFTELVFTSLFYLLVTC